MDKALRPENDVCQEEALAGMASRGRSPQPGESVPHRFCAWARRLESASFSRSPSRERLGQATIFVDADGVHPSDSEADYRHQHLGEHLDHRASRPRRVACCASPPGSINAHRARSPGSHSCSTLAAQPRAPISSISTSIRAARPKAPKDTRRESRGRRPHQRGGAGSEIIF